MSKSVINVDDLTLWSVWLGLIICMQQFIIYLLILHANHTKVTHYQLYLRWVLKWGYRYKATSCFRCCSSVVNSSLTSSIPHWMQKGMHMSVFSCMCTHSWDDNDWWAVGTGEFPSTLKEVFCSCRSFSVAELTLHVKVRIFRVHREIFTWGISRT